MAKFVTVLDSMSDNYALITRPPLKHKSHSQPAGDLDIVTISKPFHLIDGLIDALDADGIAPIQVWPYAYDSITILWMSRTSGDCVQTDLTTPRGLSLQFGINLTDFLHDRRRSDGAWFLGDALLARYQSRKQHKKSRRTQLARVHASGKFMYRRPSVIHYFPRSIDQMRYWMRRALCPIRINFEVSSRGEAQQLQSFLELKVIRHVYTNLDSRRWRFGSYLASLKPDIRLVLTDRTTEKQDNFNAAVEFIAQANRHSRQVLRCMS